MGIFSNNLSTRDHLDSLNFRMYLLDLKKQISQEKYKGLKELTDNFEGEIPKTNGPMRVYRNYCAFRACAKETFGGIQESLRVFIGAIQGKPETRENTQKFIGHLIDRLTEEA